MSEKLSVNLLASTDPSVSFDKTSTPLIITAFQEQGHDVTLKSMEDRPTPAELLDCDVFIDRSPITDTGFFRSLALQRLELRRQNKRAPLMVDNPFATMSSLDKRKTRRLMPDLVTEGYNLDGVSNHEAISHFERDEWVVIKDPLGWYSRGTDRVSPEEAHDKYGSVRDMTVEKYIPFIRGVGRVLTMNYGANFQIICNYLMIPNSWRTGEGVSVTHELTDCPDDLQLFAQTVSKRSGLYLNGMDYIERAPQDVKEEQNKYALLEVNAVPNLRVPLHYLGVDAPGKLVKHIEQSALQL